MRRTALRLWLCWASCAKRSTSSKIRLQNSFKHNKSEDSIRVLLWAQNRGDNHECTYDMSKRDSRNRIIWASLTNDNCIQTNEVNWSIWTFRWDESSRHAICREHGDETGRAGWIGTFSRDRGMIDPSQQPSSVFWSVSRLSKCVEDWRHSTFSKSVDRLSSGKLCSVIEQ